LASLPVTRYTPEQYLEMERAAETKSEYYHGEIFAMAGASEDHITIVFNIGRAIGNQILDRPCRGYASEMKVQVGAAYYYPDFVAVCGDRDFLDKRKDALMNPNVIIEVLSPSTEAYDRGLKWLEYRRTASLREYVLIAQDAMRVELYVRQDGDHWLLSILADPDAILSLESIGCAIPLRDIYRNIDFPEAP